MLNRTRKKMLGAKVQKRVIMVYYTIKGEHKGKEAYVLKFVEGGSYLQEDFIDQTYVDIAEYENVSQDQIFISNIVGL